MISILHQIESHFQFKTPVIWKNVIRMLVFHMLAVYGIFLIPTANILTLIWAYIVNSLALLGITAGVHRLWTHRTYKAKLPLRIILMLFYMMSGQYSLLQWARDHRTHHLYTDTDADPHSAARGLFYSHVGWLLMKRHPDSKAKGKNVDLNDLYKDPVIRFNQRHFFFLTLSVHIIFPSAVAYYVIGDTLKNAVFILFFLRTVIALNMTWCINSLAHYWGDKPYKIDVLATQNAPLAFLVMGEGWHNFHHAFPYDYRIGEFGQGHTFGAWAIDVCARLGLATNMRSASPTEIQRAINDCNKKKMQEGKIKDQKKKTMATRIHN